MPILKNKDYFSISKEILEDKELSWGAKGLYAFLCCRECHMHLDILKDFPTSVELIKELVSKNLISLED